MWQHADHGFGFEQLAIWPQDKGFYVVKIKYQRAGDSPDDEYIFGAEVLNTGEEIQTRDLFIVDHTSLDHMIMMHNLRIFFEKIFSILHIPLSGPGREPLQLQYKRILRMMDEMEIRLKQNAVKPLEAARSSHLQLEDACLYREKSALVRIKRVVKRELVYDQYLRRDVPRNTVYDLIDVNTLETYSSVPYEKLSQISDARKKIDIYYLRLCFVCLNDLCNNLAGLPPPMYRALEGWPRVAAFKRTMAFHRLKQAFDELF